MLSQYALLPMKCFVRIHPFRRVRLKQTKLTKHAMWQMKLNSPVAYQWAPHMPEIPIPSAHRIQPELHRVTKTLSFSIRLPFHLQNGIECKIDIELR